MVHEADVWIDDRNFCTTALLTGIAERDAFFVTRQHAGLPWSPAGPEKKSGSVDTGTLFEQAKVTLKLQVECPRLKFPVSDSEFDS